MISGRRALVLGGSGLVGAALMRQLRAAGADCLGTYIKHPAYGLRPLDITVADQVRDCMNDFRPELLFLTAALTAVDYCEDHSAEAFRVNVEGSRIVALEASKINAKLVFFSTEYVFDGQAGPYDETAMTSPLSVYGKSKLEAEKVVAALSGNALILRTTVVYGWQPDSQNFAMQIFRRFRAGEKITVPNDQIGTPTLAQYLAETSLRLADAGVCGIVNIAGKDLMARSAFAQVLVQTYGGNPGLVVPVSTETLKQRAPRPLRGGLRTEKLAKLTGCEAISIEEAMRRLTLERETGLITGH